LWPLGIAEEPDDKGNAPDVISVCCSRRTA
jgi:hypothetical protein